MFSAKSFSVTKIATLVASVLLGLSGARAVNLWLHAHNNPQETEARDIIRHSAKPTKNKADYERLVGMHLLGKVEKKAPEPLAKEMIINAPETRLNLKLIGVLFDRDNKDGYAIISESGKPQKTFHKGDKVSGDVTLFAVETNRVILARNGRHETLTLIKPDLHANGPISINANTPGTPIQAWKRSLNIKKRPSPETPAKGFSKTGQTF